MSITINIDKLLSFYDKIPDDDRNRGAIVSAITGLIGEDLILGLLKHCFNRRIKILSGQPKGIQGLHGHQKKLDAWILIDGKDLYQVEIKNWSAWSKNGEPVDEENLGETGDQNRESYLYTTNTKDAERVWKVLRPMQLPEYKKYQNFMPKPFLAFWCPILPATIETPFSNFSIKNKRILESIDSTGFPKDLKKVYKTVSIFSASLYLRQLRKKTNRIKLEMPRAKDRIDYIHQLLPGALTKASRSK